MLTHPNSARAPWSLQLTAFALGFTGILYEFVFSQWLSALFGGTLLQYILCFSIYAFALGLGIAFFHIIEKRIESRQFLIFLQLALFALSLSVPQYFRLIDPVLNPLESFTTLNIIGFFPALIFGLLTGLELPLIMSLHAQKKIQFLSLDFLGMSLATLLFPFVFLYEHSLPSLVYLCSFIHLLTIVFISRAPNSHSSSISTDESRIENNTTNTSILYLVFLSFILAFCSFSYQSLLVKKITTLSGAQTEFIMLAVGLFLFGMGAAGLHYEYRKSSLRFIKLVRIEGLLVTAALVASLWMVGLHLIEQLLPFSLKLQWGLTKTHFLFVLLNLIPSLIIGFLTGYELPLIFDWWEKDKIKSSWLWLLFSNHIGTLLAGLVVAFLVPKLVDTSAGLILVALINWLILISLIVKLKKNRLLLILSAFVAAPAPYLLSLDKTVQQVWLRSLYNQISLTEISFPAWKNAFQLLNELPSILRKETPYQTVDVVQGHLNNLEVGLRNWALFLDQKPQFYMGSSATYHESMVVAAKNMSPLPPKNILILGGGDGLLAQEIFKFLSPDKVTLVEIDPFIIELAQNNLNLSLANQQILTHPSIEIILDDAYRFLRKNTLLYDLIFIDFPYPSNFDLMRLYSLEFYQQVHSHLSPDGAIVFDAPLYRNKLNASRSDIKRIHTLYWTLKRAGFSSPFAFGPIEPFVFALKSGKTANFNYQKLPAGLRNSTFINLLAIDFLEAENQINTPINQNIKPSKWTDDE